MKDTLNLLPAAAESATKEKNWFIIAISGAILLYLIILTGIRIKTDIEIRKIAGEKESLAASKTGLKARISSAQTAAASAKPSALSEIAGNLGSSRPWSMLISELSRIVPEQVWLSSIEIKQDPAVLHLKGFSVSQMEIASLISSMERSDLFQGVEIVSSQKGAKEHSFELKAKMTWPDRN
jgi:Tfp pilus assembly protein PilN